MALVTVQRSPTPSTTSSPCVSESGSGEEDRRSQPRSISESFLTVKGAALFLPRGNGSSLSSASRFSQLRSKHAGDLQQHLQTMFTLLRPEDNIKLAVRLESTLYQGTRYMVVVSTNGRQDTEESLVLGMDFSLTDSSCSVGLVLPLWSDTLIHLDGDGGFSVSTDNRIHVFKPVSVQAMWSALQSLHKACEVARCHNYFPGSLFLTWVSYYQSRVSSDQSRINEWNAMKDVQSHRADSPVLFSDVPTERERTERLIKTRLREIMMQKDLENVTCKEIRTELEEHMVCNLREFKEYIDNEMIVILGQMDSPTEIFDHVYLGSEWNASNLEELQNSGVQYILNVTREIDNFFPGLFEYHNIRVYDEEATDLLAYWNDTYKFISRAKKAGAKCLVHCKMGVSRSASTVIAYAMKEYGWDLGRAFDYVKERRAVTKPNPSFMRQLEEYQGILLASKQRHNKLWRSHSDSDLSEHHEPLCKPVHHTLGRSDLRNQGNSPNAPSLEELLQPLGSPSNTGQIVRSVSESGSPCSAAKVAWSGGQPCKNQETRDDALTSASTDQSRHSVDRTAVPTGSRVQGESCGAVPPDAAPPAGSVCLPSPPLSNGQCNLEEDPSTPPLPRPQAATAVPGVSTVTAAETVPVERPHPPASPQHAPVAPAPPLPPSGTDRPPKAEEPSSHMPRHPQVAETSAPVPVRKHDCDSHLTGGAVDCSGAQQPPGDEGFGLQDPASSALSTDHINFFSAREKFQGLAQDGRTRCLSDQAVQHTPQLTPRAPGPEQQEDPSAETPVEGGEEEEKKRGSIVSVHLIVTELESMAHSLAPPPGQSEPLLSQDQKVGQSNQEVEEKESQQEVEAVKEEAKVKAQETEAATDSPVLSGDWAMGSVRRVTQQLEQRMRQEHDSPSPPPPSLPLTANNLHRRSLVLHYSSNPHPEATSNPHPEATSNPHPEATSNPHPEATSNPHPEATSNPHPEATSNPHPEATSNPHPEATSNPQNASLCSPGTGVKTVQEDGACSPMEEDGGQETGRGSSHTNSPVSAVHPTHIARQRLAVDHASSAGFLCLEGVTEQESSTDGGDPTGRHGHAVVVTETWETLRELGAFLCQVNRGGAKVSRRVGQAWGEVGAAGRSGAAGCNRERAREVEVRIRKAGLTPPSLMKRSASLAKLDCLELSANDLSYWELSPASPGTHSVESPTLATVEDCSKKLRMLSHNASCPNTCAVLTSVSDSLRTQGEGTVEGGHTCSERSPQSGQAWQGGASLDSGLALMPCLISVATRQQYERTHPLRRFKKRTVSTLYHTI
ncbi:uncharacterized protein LOC105031270 isoform X2 [Esox lucius]|uniref:protein-serine/threonine phosphatase n=1 Tax=Esox lucius TaxID=8010 RepID=A0AAY5L6G0_ESOLU|nr:uncharacterized protein LOC105031270 isoform X2 [Esox lucius]